MDNKFVFPSSDQGKHVSSLLYSQRNGGRFDDVFTKLQVLRLEPYEKVLFLDLDIIVRDVGELDALFESCPAPAALGRVGDSWTHGKLLPYDRFWRGYKRKMWEREDSGTGAITWQQEKMHAWEQASGINAGVMMLRPSQHVWSLIEEEIAEWNHPEHYGM